VVGSADAGPKTIAESLMQKILSLSLDKNGFSKMDAAAPAIRQLLASVPEGARQALADALGGVSDDALGGAGAKLGRHASASPKAGAQIPVEPQPDGGASAKPGAQNLAQAHSQLAGGASARPGAQSPVQAQTRPADGAGASLGAQGSVQPQAQPAEGASAKLGPQAPAPVQGAPIVGAAPKLDMQKLIQAV
jgi:hypothetical protein